MKLISAIEDKPLSHKPVEPCQFNLGAARLKAMRREREIQSHPILGQAALGVGVFATLHRSCSARAARANQSANSMCLSKTTTPFSLRTML